MIPRRSILAHRGLWSEPREQNSLNALFEAIRMGFGIETDVRDSNSELVISHDLPKGTEPDFRDLLEFVLGLEAKPVIAFNVKADGLASFLKPFLASSLPDGSFFFDMSAPETLLYQKADLPTAVRISEYENPPDWERLRTRSSKTIWLDCFDSDWWLDVAASDLVPVDWTVYIVSSELHGREPDLAWERLQERDWEDKGFGICTDHPMEFFRFIGGSVE